MTRLCFKGCIHVLNQQGGWDSLKQLTKLQQLELRWALRGGTYIGVLTHQLEAPDAQTAVMQLITLECGRKKPEWAPYLIQWPLAELSNTLMRNGGFDERGEGTISDGGYLLARCDCYDMRRPGRGVQ